MNQCILLTLGDLGDEAEFTKFIMESLTKSDIEEVNGDILDRCSCPSSFEASWRMWLNILIKGSDVILLKSKSVLLLLIKSYFQFGGEASKHCRRVLWLRDPRECGDYGKAGGHRRRLWQQRNPLCQDWRRDEGQRWVWPGLSACTSLLEKR